MAVMADIFLQPKESNYGISVRNIKKPWILHYSLWEWVEFLQVLIVLMIECETMKVGVEFFSLMQMQSAPFLCDVSF